MSQRCVGNTGSVPRLGVPSLCLQDSPTGVRLTDYNTAFMAGVTIASTWDKGALYARGYAMGQEFRGKGAHIGLLPVCGPMGKAPEAGRFAPPPQPVLTVETGKVSPRTLT
jgi:beta-glucosidase